MNKIDWTKWSAIAEIFSAIAIVVTLIYLAVQTQYLAEQTEQNNRLMSSAGVASLNDKAMEWNARVAENPGVAEILLKASRGETLSETETFRLQSLHNVAMDGWAMDFLQYDAGLIPPEYLNTTVPRYRSAFLGIPKFAEYWDEAKVRYPDSFVEFIDECVVQICEGLEELGSGG